MVNDADDIRGEKEAKREFLLAGLKNINEASLRRTLEKKNKNEQCKASCANPFRPYCPFCPLSKRPGAKGDKPHSGDILVDRTTAIFDEPHRGGILTNRTAEQWANR